MAKKRKKTPAEKAEATTKMGRHFGRISRAPLKRQNSSDAWNERQNRLTAGRDAAKLLIRGALEKNLAKKGTNSKTARKKKR